MLPLLHFALPLPIFTPSLLHLFLYPSSFIPFTTHSSFLLEPEWCVCE
jgi:hypothetical protein